jgi:hypothetical protein
MEYGTTAHNRTVYAAPAGWQNVVNSRNVMRNPLLM